MEYAVVDIETTGGAVENSGITEIAIRIFNGKQVLESYDTLINPEKRIPSYIVALTGITQEMVQDSPKFSAIAAKVFSLLDGRVFVAHNVNFDYSFIKQALQDAGFSWTAKRLCTLRFARKVKPGLASYSLGRLCAYFSIPHKQRHRAAGDVDATVTLFELLCACDEGTYLQRTLKGRGGEERLPAHLDKQDYENLPEVTGVYYFLNKQGKVIYVGKAKNIKKRVQGHFSGHQVSARRQNFIREIYHISYEVCGSELMALLFECQEIKRLWPIYNRALKHMDLKYGLLCYEDQKGYLRLGVGKRIKHMPYIQAFDRLSEAAQTLWQLRDSYVLDPALCSFSGSGGKKTNQHSCKEPPIHYNKRVEQAIASLDYDAQSFLIVDKGRKLGEQSCIWVEKSQVKGMGYIEEDVDLNHKEDIFEHLQPCISNAYMRTLVQAYAQKYPARVYPI